MKILFLLIAALPAFAQCPNPVSDGALNITANEVFDPVARNIGDANNVFCFSSVNVANSVELRFHANKMRNPVAPVFFYVQGAFTLGSFAKLNLNGESGALEFTTPSLVGVSLAQELQLRRPSIPGPGGFPGGVGQAFGVPAEPGGGPGGGPAGLVSTNTSCHGGLPAHATVPVRSNIEAPAIGVNNTTYANVSLLPIYGGSGGGGGGGANPAAYGGIGGAGGGAIRIVAGSISLGTASTISARGGEGFVTSGNASCKGGPGAGGSIHLMSLGSMTPITFANNINISTNGGSLVFGLGSPSSGGRGAIRIGGNSGGLCQGCDGVVTFGPAFTPPAQTSAPSLRIVSIAGVAAPAAATGSITNPDVRISSNSPVSVQLAASNIPLNTVVSLRVNHESNPDQIIACTPLTGTIANSTATCTVTYAHLGSMSSLRATW